MTFSSWHRQDRACSFATNVLKDKWRDGTCYPLSAWHTYSLEDRKESDLKLLTEFLVVKLLVQAKECLKSYDFAVTFWKASSKALAPRVCAIIVAFVVPNNEPPSPTLLRCS